MTRTYWRLWKRKNQGKNLGLYFQQLKSTLVADAAIDWDGQNRAGRSLRTNKCFVYSLTNEGLDWTGNAFGLWNETGLHSPCSRSVLDIRLVFLPCQRMPEPWKSIQPQPRKMWGIDVHLWNSVPSHWNSVCIHTPCSYFHGCNFSFSFLSLLNLILLLRTILVKLFDLNSRRLAVQAREPKGT